MSDGDKYYNERKLFHTGDLQGFLSEVADSSPDNDGLKAMVARAEAATGVSSSGGKDDLSAAKAALATLTSAAKGKKAKAATEAARKVLDNTSDPAARLVAATAVLAGALASGDGEAIDGVAGALEEISEAQDLGAGSLEALALQVQAAVCRGEGVGDDAVEEAHGAVENAKAWSHDAPALQLCAGWVDVVRGGSDAYRAAYYTFQEYADTADASGAGAARMAVAQAVTELLMGNLDEAAATLDRALENTTHKNADALANKAVLEALKPAAQPSFRTHLDNLAQVDPSHPLLAKLKTKEDEFDRLAKGYLDGVTAA
ncbi:hypothetical protein PYCC9005_006006 [Savitreella phatthalungensis]